MSNQNHSNTESYYDATTIDRFSGEDYRNNKSNKNESYRSGSQSQAKKKLKDRNRRQGHQRNQFLEY